MKEPLEKVLQAARTLLREFAISWSKGERPVLTRDPLEVVYQLDLHLVEAGCFPRGNVVSDARVGAPPGGWSQDSIEILEPNVGFVGHTPKQINFREFL